MTYHLKRRVITGLAVAMLAIAGCGGDDDEGDGGGAAGGGEETQADANVEGNLSLVGVWTAEEQKSFQAVLDGFEKKYPNVKVKYNPAGDNTPTVLGTAIEGGNPPDIATVAQPGLISDFAERGALKSLDFARADLEENYPPDFIELGTVDGQLVSFVFKGANKSTVWHNVEAFTNAGVEQPATFDEMVQAAETLKASGTPAYSLAGADGWTLTDLFENVYLRQAGPDKYDQLSTHEIPWTDQSVKDALETMAQIFSDEENIVGGTSGALETDFPTSVSNVFTNPAKGAMVIEGDFVPGVVAGKTKLEAGTGYDVFPFPDIGESSNYVVGGGDSVVMFKDSPAAQALVKYLISPEAHEIRAKLGGFSSPNKNLEDSAYPDEITAQAASGLSEAETFRFDMSDLAPAAFGGTPGQGEWKILQDFMQNPDDIDGTARKLETAAKRAFK
jgi:ABC-type glycerol-3-phosphate transport system substrate-binding protein